MKTLRALLAALFLLIAVPSWAAVTVTNLTAGFSTSNASSFDTASITITSGRFYLMIVTAASGTNNNAPSGVATASNTFSSHGNHAQGTTRRTSYWSLLATTTEADTITISFAETHNNATWAVVEIDGHDSSGTVVQDDFATGGASAETSGTVTLTNALGSTDNAVIVLMAIGGTSSAITEDADFTAVAEATNTESGRASSAYAFNQTTATHTFSSAIWGGGIFEIKAAATGVNTDFFRRRINW